MKCDRCGKRVIITNDPREESGGTCALCGEYLCAKCAGEFDEYCCCEQCQEEMKAR